MRDFRIKFSHFQTTELHKIDEENDNQKNEVVFTTTRVQDEDHPTEFNELRERPVSLERNDQNGYKFDK